ncbi:MAG: hypothetical protein A2534_04900 [Candidatus Magasanikbacteria bacterium RIFOXYD2_FULL_39_9]|uniref:Uncharacterized protein n=1 Tax=Candidatus Magasanikbacteria bacterium RIFOXYD1_FULL_40_23 TaxID=1798705 RepID=A0A1F6P877_9BACT|nr:MAG: hypothetical protein A2534_04900 [Candidatus Magasanikbacteria bacterium RIFOXYD2_FULL_39_9]OGH92379.1 MAG: hypothetical protein A2563_05370 [Candidatus Magasanikbacteria bacterium RIFOXYD1_FULL_40_23]
MPKHEGGGMRENQESEAEFAKRVLESTGVDLKDMQEGDQGELVGSHIFCQRGDVFVIATGYPSRTDETTGQEFWEDPKSFKKITFKGSK